MHDIYVYGEIGASAWDDDCVSAKDFIDELNEAAGDDVTVHINSCGGSVFEAAAMADAIARYAGEVTASIEGLAASAASYFALTAKKVVMNPYALMMIHNPSGWCMGTAEDMRGVAESLDKVRGTIVSAYERKTGMGADEIGGLMDAETWFSADEALERGFVDGLSDGGPVTARIDPKVVARYRNAPDAIKCATEPPAGEGDPTIVGDDAGGDKSKAGAADDGAGAAPEPVCINGTFLYVKKEN